MTLIKNHNLNRHISSIIHGDTQQHPDCMDLTVDSICEFTKAGSLDFGGSEFKSAEMETIVPKKKDQNDDYGWWHLSQGSYRAIMNEKIERSGNTNIMAFLTPHEHARQAGIISNSLLFSIEEEKQAISINFQVPKTGCSIKENARLAVLYLFEL